MSTVKEYFDDPSEEKAKVSSSHASSNSTSFKKKSKNSSKNSLQSIDENEISQNDFNSSDLESVPFSCFGIKSYLHEFYAEGINDLNQQVQRKRTLDKIRARNKCLRFLWKLLFWIGFFLMVLASAMLIYGFYNKEKPVYIGSIEQVQIVDKSALKFNEFIENCKVFGLILFTLAGAIVSLSFILPSFICYKQCIYKDDLFDFEPIEIYSSDYELFKRKVKFEHVQPKPYKHSSIKSSSLIDSNDEN